MELQGRISEQQEEKYQLELRCERFENEFARLAEQNREVSIVLSKKGSFNYQGLTVRAPDGYQVNKADSLFTFSQSGDSPLPFISPNGQFLRTRTIGGGRSSD